MGEFPHNLRNALHKTARDLRHAPRAALALVALCALAVGLLLGAGLFPRTITREIKLYEPYAVHPVVVPAAIPGPPPAPALALAPPPPTPPAAPVAIVAAPPPDPTASPVGLHLALKEQQSPLTPSAGDRIARTHNGWFVVEAAPVAMHAQPLPDGTFEYAYSFGVGPPELLAGLDHRLDLAITRLLDDDALQRDLTVTPTQLARLRATTRLPLFPVEQKPNLESLFQSYHATPEGPARQSASAALLAALRQCAAAELKARTDRLEQRKQILTPDQLARLQNQSHR